MKFIEIQIVETASHRIERTINITAQNIYKKYRWHTGNIKGGTNGQTYRRFTTDRIVVF